MSHVASPTRHIVMRTASIIAIALLSWSALVGVAQAQQLAVTVPGIAATEGTGFSGPVGTFTDPVFPFPSNLYLAQIDWGDGTIDPCPAICAITGPDGFGVFTVSGTHTYADEGSFTLTVSAYDTIAQISGANSGTAAVAEADVLVVDAGTPRSISATEGSAFSGTVALFDNTGYPTNPASDFTATIDWGDGNTDNCPASCTISGPVAGVYTVSGTHTYADEGTYNMAVTLSDDPPGTATATANPTANVSDAALTPSGTTVAPTEGTAFTGAIGSFTDGNPIAPLTDFDTGSSVDWGDGSATDACSSNAGTTPNCVISQPGGVGTAFTVTGTHTYAEEASGVPVTITITDDGGSTATINSTANIAEGDVLTPNPMIIAPIEGNAFNGAVATFTNTGYPTNPASDFTATIDWGDGSPTATGNVTGPVAGVLTVSGGHTYVEEGTRPVTVTLTDDPPGTATATANSTANVQDAPLTATRRVINLTEDSLFTGVVASFTDGNPLAPASEFTATIDWGDGSPITNCPGAGCTITGPVGGPFTIRSTHLYHHEGFFPITVAILDEGGSTATANSQARVISRYGAAPLMSPPVILLLVAMLGLLGLYGLRLQRRPQ